MILPYGLRSHTITEVTKFVCTFFEYNSLSIPGAGGKYLKSPTFIFFSIGNQFKFKQRGEKSFLLVIYLYYLSCVYTSIKGILVSHFKKLYNTIKKTFVKSRFTLSHLVFSLSFLHVIERFCITLGYRT